jgi:hypothetical protein
VGILKGMKESIQIQGDNSEASQKFLLEKHARSTKQEILLLLLHPTLNLTEAK